MSSFSNLRHAPGSNNKRVATGDLFKENEPSKKKSKTGDVPDAMSGYMDGALDERDYSRVEHVDGRYGF